jgi:hypothetical protein
VVSPESTILKNARKNKEVRMQTQQELEVAWSRSPASRRTEGSRSCLERGGRRGEAVRPWLCFWRMRARAPSRSGGDICSETKILCV